MAGNTSKYEIITDRRTNTTKFVKTVDKNSFNFSTVTFQRNLSENFTSTSLKVVKPLELFEVSSSEVAIDYVHVDAITWDATTLTMSELGKGLAELHNHCYRDAHLWSLLEKKTNPVNMGTWDSIEDSHDKMIAVDLRNFVFKNLYAYNDKQPCLPAHRDFKLHNILYDGTTFHLIDFDFAAIDNIGIEIVSFIIDVHFNYKNIGLIDAFVSAYKHNSTIPIDWQCMLNDYMVYMCCNTFPFYMREKIGEENFRALFDERNHKLHFTYTNKDQIYESLSR